MTENSELSEFERKQIVNAMEHVLSTDKFVAAPQMSAFLRYVVEQTVSGNQDRIKAYTVAVDALGKPDTFDPQNDPVVRVLAGRLRSSLDAYYEAHAQTNVVIQMRPGSYVPVFVNQQKGSDSNVSPGDQTAAPSIAEHVSTLETAELDQETPVIPSDPGDTGNGVDRIDNNNDVELPALGNPNVTSDAGLKIAPTSVMATDSGLPVSLFNKLRQTPKTAIAAGLLAIMLLSSLVFRSTPNDEPDIEAAIPSLSAISDQSSNRARPEQLSLFVSAMDEGNVLENQLNSMMSGVFSESNLVRVYRILDSNTNFRFWPEDYVLSLEVLNLPTETRIGIQLMAAHTGRISHSDTLVLSSAAMQRLTHDELEQITEFSRNLVSEQGPMLADYESSQERNAEER